ncbi:MAG TPA: tripartite tricarboxylate transporter substrate binding protein [Variovorax sp.]|nr:tripartite tricarboxylate transporter substrate binding protein [Variovorax sp.]
MDLNKRRWLEGLAGAAAGLCLPTAWAQSDNRARASSRPADNAWPNRPIKLLVGFPAGSSPDLAARAISEPLSQLLRQTVVVENKPGASGNVAADLVAKSTDEHTFGALINGNLTIARLLNGRTPFDPEKDFAPIGLIGTAPLVLTLTGNAEGKTPVDLVHWARSQGASASYGSPGNGTVGHLGMELLKSRTGITARHEGFNGNPAVITAMLAGKVQMALLPPALAMPHVQAGKLRAVGVTSPEPSPLVSGMNTLRDASVRGADLEIWTALAGPASLPEPIVDKFNAALSEVVRRPEVNKRLLDAGWQAQPGSAEALAKRMRRDTSMLGGVILMRGIRSDA